MTRYYTGQPDDYWRERVVEEDGLCAALDLAIDRIGGFMADPRNKLGKKSEGWLHLECTVDLLWEIKASLTARKTRIGDR